LASEAGIGAEEMPRRPRALTIAGSDSGGGAGIQADLKTFSALGVFGMTAITAITVQNTRGVTGVQLVDPEIVADQISAVASDIGVDAAKTGMLASAPIIEAVARAVEQTPVGPIVVDPVFVSKHGDRLLAEDAVGALRASILPIATLVTPNLAEAGALVGYEVADRAAMLSAAEDLLGMGVAAVLVKGGHLDEPVAADLFLHGGEELWLEEPRVDTRDTHGTGCTLSAAIAAHLASGTDLREAVIEGKAFVTGAIRNALRLGAGIGPVDHIWRIGGGG
jgi:hydroxymethylpyrimidine/phosphomethylpyrimidine kinase